MDIQARFWAKVDRRGDDECWEWIASRNNYGYGQLSSRRGQAPFKAHRLSWEFANGPIPDGLHILHRCDNPPCVNPAHLWAGTHKENHQDRAAKGRIPLNSLLNLRPGAPGFHGAGPVSRREREC